MTVTIKRVYESPSPKDGQRILVDRLWPRGLSKADAKVDVWLKDIAPSAELRQWFGHDPAKWDEFQQRFIKELSANTEAVSALHNLLKTPSTLVYGAKDEAHNNAVVIQSFIK